MPVTIATWFVADDPSDATYFPQIGSKSDAPSAQAAYWRCTVCFFASSMAVNPGADHVFYTNVALPRVDGTDLAVLFDAWGINIVQLPVTTRLPCGSVAAWGNQFYVFDVMAHHAQMGPEQALILLDSDCIWIRSANALLHAIASNGALTYELGEKEYPRGSDINGQTREGLARFAGMHSALQFNEVAYCGGEIYAASAACNRAIVARMRELWSDVAAQGPDAPREEAHLLSVIYALEGIAPATANRLISRMWTTFKHNTLSAADEALTIWHLPSEKRTGFAKLFAQIVRSSPANPRTNARSLGLTFENYARTMGWPRRRPAKFVSDLALKLHEKWLK